MEKEYSFSTGEWFEIKDKDRLFKKYSDLIEKANIAMEQGRITEEACERLKRSYYSAYKELHKKGIEVYESYER